MADGYGASDVESILTGEAPPYQRGSQEVYGDYRTAGSIAGGVYRPGQAAYSTVTFYRTPGGNTITVDEADGRLHYIKVDYPGGDYEIWQVPRDSNHARTR